MAGHRKFRELIADWPKKRQERVSRQVESALAAMELNELVRERGLTQEDLANRLSLAQGNVSRTLRRGDMKVSTLGDVVTAMGGRLEIVARFPDQDVRISQFEASVGSRTRTGRGAIASKQGEKTSPKVAKVRGRASQKAASTPRQAKTLAASALTQTANMSKSGGKKK